MIKNRTPYLGKVRLKFESNPHYSGRTLLNKVHVNLGFTKLVSRVEPDRDENGFVVDPVKLDLINMYTDGQVGLHKFGPNNEHELSNSFLAMDGSYIGSIKEGWWYFQNGMTVCHEYPRGVAMVWRTAKFDKTILSGTDGLEGYYGYSHRGGALFKKGDRLFDPDYEPQVEDYTPEQWMSFVEKAQAAEERNRREGWDDEVSIKSVVPFNLRGKVVITDWPQALQAAIAMSKYLS